MKRDGVLFILIMTCLAFSCKQKEFNFTLQGKITDLTFNKGLKDAKITLEEVIPGSTAGPLIHETIVASDGTYSLTFKRNKATKYILTITKENYFDINQEISFSEFSTETALEKNFTTTAKAWVKLTFVNTLPSSDVDELKYIKQEGKVDCEICCPGGEQHIYGKMQQSVLCVNDANTKYSYYYFSTNPGANGLEEIYTPAFDTVELIKTW